MKRTLEIIAVLIIGTTIAGAVKIWVFGTSVPKSPNPAPTAEFNFSRAITPPAPAMESEFDLSCVITPGGTYPRDCVDGRPGSTWSIENEARQAAAKRGIDERETRLRASMWNAAIVAETERRAAEQAKRERQQEIQEAVEAALVKDSLLRPKP